ncbi:MAG TPA: hypothetical protein VNT77_06825 [Allosphingosinicella sp.]|nr:hypothetical protein [Allosphingosinicella sp.]
MWLALAVVVGGLCLSSLVGDYLLLQAVFAGSAALLAILQLSGRLFKVRRYLGLSFDTVATGTLWDGATQLFGRGSTPSTMLFVATIIMFLITWGFAHFDGPFDERDAPLFDD